MFTTNVFYTKVIDVKGEGNGARCVSPKTGCVVCWNVAKGGKDIYAFSLVKNASLEQTVHAAGNFKKDVSVTDECMEVIFVHGFLGQRPNWDSYIFVS